jgi:UDP-glucose 4-epimerase
MKRWLITGGLGFIGLNLVERLLREEDVSDIRIIDDLSGGSPKDLRQVTDFSIYKPYAIGKDLIKNKRVQLAMGNICNSAICKSVCHGMDIIVHLAASAGVQPSIQAPLANMKVNIEGTLNILKAAADNAAKRVIFASSGAAVGDVSGPIHETILPKPISPYGVSKLTGEAYCHAFYHSYGLETVALRFSNVYGPKCRMKTSVVAKFCKQALADKSITIYGDGQQTRDFIYVGDLVEAILHAASVPMTTEVFQIATGKETTIEDLIRTIVEVKGNDVQIEEEPLPAGDVLKSVADISKAQNILNWAPKVNLAEGVKQTLLYLSNQPS